MRILISGATGFIGKHLIHVLSGTDHEPVCLTRDPERAKEILPQDVPCYHWDYLSRKIDRKAFNGIQAVIHLAGENIASSRWSREKKKKIINSRELGTAFLVEMLRRLNQAPELFISTSATGYYGDRNNKILTESSPPGPDFLAETCMRWEATALKAKNFISRVIIMRMGMVLAKNGGPLSRMVPIFKMGLGAKLGSGKQWVPWIHVEDLKRIFLHMLKQADCKGIYNVCSPEPVTNAMFTKTLAKTLSHKAPFIIPSLMLKIILGEIATFLLASTKTIPKRLLDSGFEYKYPTIEKAMYHLFS